MSFEFARVALEVTPFIATIVVELLYRGGSDKFSKTISDISISEAVDEADLEDIENASIHSFHYEQSMRYFDFTIIAIFIVFLTKSGRELIPFSLVTVGGLSCIVIIIGLKRYARHYFENTKPNEYSNDKILFQRPRIIRHGEGLILLANSIPITVILLLELCTII